MACSARFSNRKGRRRSRAKLPMQISGALIEPWSPETCLATLPARNPAKVVRRMTPLLDSTFPSRLGRGVPSGRSVACLALALALGFAFPRTSGGAVAEPPLVSLDSLHVEDDV